MSAWVQIRWSFGRSPIRPLEWRSVRVI
jgi:hypothetical protein